jgi:hypothetical protein
MSGREEPSVSEAPQLDRGLWRAGGLYSHPDAGELLDAIIEFLTGLTVADEQAFHLRVAVNALSIVRRELQSGVADEAAHRQRLAELGFADDADLASALRDGHVPASMMAPVRAALLADAEARLRVANPRFVAAYEAERGSV